MRDTESSNEPTGLADGLEVGVLYRLRSAPTWLSFGRFAPWRGYRAGGSPATPFGVLGVNLSG